MGKRRREREAQRLKRKTKKERKLSKRAKQQMQQTRVFESDGDERRDEVEDGVKIMDDVVLNQLGNHEEELEELYAMEEESYKTVATMARKVRQKIKVCDKNLSMRTHKLTGKIKRSLLKSKEADKQLAAEVENDLENLRSFQQKHQQAALKIVEDTKRKIDVILAKM